MILHVLRTYLERYSHNGSSLPHHRSPCGSSECPTLIGDIEFVRNLDKRNAYKPKPLPCAHCGRGSVLGAGSFPANFLARLTGEAPRGIYDEIKLPRFDKYRCHTIIQYNTRLKHFRTIKTYPNKVEIMDGQNYEIIEGRDPATVIFNNGWFNYIGNYERK
jgi:hypothetical protein